MTRRLLTIISGAPLPNYIAINETTSRPDVAHCIFTPAQGGMDARLASLQQVATRNIPGTRFELHPVADPYDSAAVWQIAYDLLTRHAGDEWFLNRTAGTEQMRAPLADAFRLSGKESQSFCVETERNQITFSAAGWRRTSQPFAGSISVEDYFALHGQTVTQKQPDQRNGAEADLVRQLEMLRFDCVAPNCVWSNGINRMPMAEYDVAAIAGYRLHVFERKRMRDFSSVSNSELDAKARAVRQAQGNNALHDVEKLAYTRAIFGGPFGRVYWVLSGGYQIPETLRNRIPVLNVTLIDGERTQHIASRPQDFGLPARR